MPNLCGSLLTIFYLPCVYAAEMDYTSLSRSLTFNNNVMTQAVEVPIIADHIVEYSEIINLTLVSTDSAVILNPSTSTITIEDVDCKLQYGYSCEYKCNSFIFTTSVVTIGFSRATYSVSEDAGSTSVIVFIQSGTLDRDVVVTLSTISGTSMCKFLSEPQQQLVCYFSHIHISLWQLDVKTLFCHVFS